MPQTPVDRATLTPPRPGAWELEQTHLTGPPSGFIAPIFPVAMPRGFGAGLREYGTLLEPFDVAIIGGFIYMCPRAVGAPLDAEGPPPRLVFEIMRRIHPEMRRRMAKAKTVFSDKRWRTDVALWDNEVKPSLLAEAAALKAEDPRAMDDARLADHVRRTAAFLARAIESHHRFNVCALMPVGDFLVQATAWTGLTPSALLEACRGLSAPSAGAMPEMARLTAALGADAEAKALLLSGGPAAAVVEQLLGLLVLQDRRAAAPVVDLTLFRNAGFMAGSAVIALQNLAMYSLLTLIPFVFGAGRDAGGRAAISLAIVAMTAAMAAASPIGGRLAERVGARQLVAAGSLLGAAGIVWLIALPADAPPATLAWRLLVIGLSIGLTTGPAQAGALGAVDASHSGMASAALSMLRYAGGIAGTVILGYAMGGARQYLVAMLIFVSAFVLAAVCGALTGTRDREAHSSAA